MDLSFRRFFSADRDSWESFVRESNNGTIFHERKFLSYHPDGRFDDHSLVIEKKGKILALLPAAAALRDGLNCLVSHPGSSYGGPVYRADLSIRDAFSIVQGLVDHSKKEGFQRLQLTLPPAIYQQRVSNYIDFALVKSGFSYQKREVSSMLNIEDSPEENLARFKPSHRTALRRAQKQGVEIRESDDFSSFYSILKQNLKIRHEVQPTHSLPELERLRKLYPNAIRLFGAFHEGQMVAGVVNFNANRNVALAFYISHDENHQHLRAVNLLFYEIIRWCNERDFRYLDFGIFTVNMDPNFGLGRFKENFGASGVFRDTFSLDL